MAESPTTTPAPAQPAPAQQAPAPQAPAQTQPEAKPFEAITSQEQLDKLLGDRLSRERAKFADYADVKAKAAKYDEATEAAKTETQKALDAATKAQQETEKARQELARERIARKHKLSDEDVEMLAGTEEQMERLAARLAAAGQQRGIVPNEGRAAPPPGSTKEMAAAASAEGDHKTALALKAQQLADMRNK